MDQVIKWLQENWFALTLLGTVMAFILRVDRRVQKLVRDVDRQERKRQEGAERNELILRSLDATLDGLHSQGCNGKVTAARNAMDSYMQKQAAR